MRTVVGHWLACGRPDGRSGGLLWKAAALCVAALGATGWAAGPDASPEKSLAQQVVRLSGRSGGLLVHVGCGDGRLTAALGVSDRFVVQGLTSDRRKLEQARKNVRAAGVYGPVSVDWFDGRTLPYVDNLVSVLVVGPGVKLERSETLRVLEPLGAAVKLTGDGQAELWLRKPWPEPLDQWTHYLHDSTGNPVSQDRVVAPPRSLQWTDGPLWARSHGWTPSVSALVTAAGRVFAICDETPTGADATLPDRWRLVARDAFSGVVLWKRPIPEWGSRAFSGTPDWGGNGVTGRFTMPHNVAKRLVAVGDTVFVTLGATAPVTALDAATGKVRRVYQQTERADELVCVDGRLVVSLNPVRRDGERALDKTVLCLDAETGRTLWKRGPFTAVWDTRFQDPFGRVDLLAGDGHVFLLTEQSVVCLDLDTGRTAWQVPRPALPETADRRLGFSGVYEYRLAVLLYHNGVLLLLQPEPEYPHTYHTMPGTLYAFDAATGRLLWKHRYGGWGHTTPPDAFVIGDRVWVHDHVPAEFDPAPANGVRPKYPEKVDYAVIALDLRTGRQLERISTRDIFGTGHHHRCYRNKATVRFLLSSRRGVEWVDLKTGTNYVDRWVRSGCTLGYVPANGLLYVTPHPCQCYIESKLKGFNALAPNRRPGRPGAQPAGVGEQANPQSAATAGASSARTPFGNAGASHARSALARQDDRLERGPAFQRVNAATDGRSPDSGSDAGRRSFERTPLVRPVSLSTAVAAEAHTRSQSDWPTYRHDPQRSGATEAEVGTKLRRLWTADVGGRLSAVTVAGGRVYVSDVDGHRVVALDAQTGRPLWEFSTGGRVDSPPTVWQGLVLFGSADGWVQCVEAETGELVWRFRAAPEDRRVVAFGQVESAWPVPGAVLLHQGLCWAAAGRSSYLDGGIRVFALEPKTGRVVRERTVYSFDPKTGQPPASDAFRLPGALNDVLVAGQSDVFLRHLNVSAGSKPVLTGAERPPSRSPHLYSTAGFLDSSWFNRTYWSYGPARTTGLLVLGGTVDGQPVAYGVEVYKGRGANTLFRPGAGWYRVLCLSTAKRAGLRADSRARRGRSRRQSLALWQKVVPVRVTGLVRAANRLLVAGPPDVVDPKDPYAAWEGRLGGRLLVLDAQTGDVLAEHKLPAPPVWDGLAVVRGKVVASLQNGQVVCLTAE